jgi:hypothetical protein
MSDPPSPITTGPAVPAINNPLLPREASEVSLPFHPRRPSDIERSTPNPRVNRRLRKVKNYDSVQSATGEAELTYRYGEIYVEETGAKMPFLIVPSHARNAAVRHDWSGRAN